MAWARTHIIWIICGGLGSFGLAGCSAPDPFSELQQGETGRVVRVIDGDALVLDTGLTVRLVGLEAPAPERRNRAGQPYADVSARLLEDLAMGRQVRLIYPGITRDRYDRALAYVKTEDRLGPELLLNREMLRRGAARARFYPDTAALGEVLLQDEQEARGNGLGLWALTDYRVQAAKTIAPDARGFFMVTATFGAASAPPQDADEDLRCVRDVSGAALKIGIEVAAAELCERSADGRTYELRGYIYEGEMDINHTLNARALSGTAFPENAIKAP